MQEEAANQGAWPFLALHFQTVPGPRVVRPITRAASAAPSTGSSKVHAAEQADLLSRALTL